MKMINYYLFTFIFSILVTYVTTESQCPAPLKNCSRDRIKFFLYTSVDEPPEELMLEDPASIKNAKFVEDADFKLLIHGYCQWKNSAVWITIREEYFKQKAWNLLVVDYSPNARWGCYFDTLKKSVKQIGHCIGDLLRLLFEQHPNITIDRFHFVGFSMGSQICGQVSNNLKPSGIIIPRITGCDPAFPGFTKLEKKEKSILNKEHAKFVDVIHSNMGYLGVRFSGAHYDIYANDGTVQPGCKLSDPRCSHNRAISIFAESINSKEKFIAQKCDSKDAWLSSKDCEGNHELKIEVGEHCTPPKNDTEIGIYQFLTNEIKPYVKALPGI